MKPAVKSKNRVNAYINKNFIIRVVVDPKTHKKTFLTSANKLSNYILDDKLKIKLLTK